MDLHSFSDHDWDLLLRQAAHDVRNPLATLLAYSELTLRKTDAPAKERTLAREGQRSVLYTTVFFDLLALHTNRYSLTLESVSVDQLVSSVQRFCTTQELPVTIEATDLDGIPFQIDMQALSFAFIALILSLLPAIGSPVTVSFVRKSKELLVTLTGRPPQKEEFLRVYSKAIIALHHGSITTQSPGKFIIRFPL